MSPKRKALRLIGYVRVSQVGEREQDGSLRSPDQQRDAITAYATAHGHTVEFLEPDLDQSGKSLDRPHFQEALRLVRTGEADGIIAARLDRLTRRVGDLGKLMTESEGGENGKGRKWNLIAVDFGLDTSTPNGKLVANIIGSLAEWELDSRRASWAVSVAGAVEDGKHVGPLPIGYRRQDEISPAFHPVSGELIRDGRLVLDEEAAPVINEAFRRRASGDSWQEIADFLTESGVLPHPRKNKATGKLVQSQRWSRTGVKGLLSNRIYLGVVRNGAAVKEGAHEAIVDEELFEASNMEGRFNPRNGNIAAQGFLTSLVSCAECGHRLSVTGSGPANGNGQRRASYFCRGNHAVGPACEHRAVAQVDKLDAHVEGVVVEALRNGDSALATVSKLGEQITRAGAAVSDAQANLDTLLAAPSSTREKLGDRFWTEVEKKQSALEAAQVELAGALRTNESLQHTVERPDGTHERRATTSKQLAAELASDETPIDRKRQIARTLVERVVVTKADPKRRRWQPIGERVEVVFRA